MSDLSKLKPCPFCGSDNVHAFHGKEEDMAWCYCRDCSANGPTASAQTEADWAWGEDNNKNPAILAAVRRWNFRQGETHGH